MDFFAQALQMGASIDVILPEAATGAIGIESSAHNDPPVLYLLHGMSDDHTIWMRRTSIERYAAQYGLAVVMPAVGRSFYADMASGPACWTYISDELPELVSRCFRVGSGRSKTFVSWLWKTMPPQYCTRRTYNPYFRTNHKIFRATDLIAELLAAPA